MEPLPKLFEVAVSAKVYVIANSLDDAKNVAREFCVDDIFDCGDIITKHIHAESQIAPDFADTLPWVRGDEDFKDKTCGQLVREGVLDTRPDALERDRLAEDAMNFAVRLGEEPPSGDAPKESPAGVDNIIDAVERNPAFGLWEDESTGEVPPLP